MNGLKFRGVFTALATPFKGGALDEDSLRALVRSQIEAGINGLVPCGTTGESPTLTHDEHKQVISITIEEAKGRAVVLAGAGSNSTAEAIDFGLHAKKVGADGLLVVNPYYNKPTQEGLFLHIQAIAKAVDLPIILYNIPGRCGVNMLPETMARMVKEIPQVAGVKEATGDLSQVIRTVDLCGPDFLVTSGDDGLALPIWSVGSGGIISVASNLIPGPMVELWKTWEQGDLKKARELFYKMLPLFKGLFVETNPIPLKGALGLAGKMSPEMRLPMSPPTAATMENLKPHLKTWGLI